MRSSIFRSSIVRNLAMAMVTSMAVMAMPARATSVSFTGEVSYSYSGSTAELKADSITNASTSASGALRLELWAFTTPHSGTDLSTGYRLSSCSVGPIAASHTLTGSDCEVPLYGPPTGNYYLSMLLTEFGGTASNDGFIQRAFGNFPGAVSLGPTSPPPTVISPQPGLWWNPAESGSGYAFDYKHGVLVVTVYSYNGDGTPLWYIVSGPVVGPTFTGKLNRTTGGQCISCAYSVPSIAGNDGTMTIVFSSSTSAIMYLPGGRIIPVIPQAF